MGSENYPDDLKYHSEHDWIRLEGDEAVFGVTWYAQDNLGDVVFFDPPAVGDTVAANGSYGELESVKEKQQSCFRKVPRSRQAQRTSHRYAFGTWSLTLPMRHQCVSRFLKESFVLKLAFRSTIWVPWSRFLLFVVVGGRFDAIVKPGRRHLVGG